MHTRCRRNEGDDEHINHFPTLSVFAPQGTAIGKERSRYLTDAEYVVAHLHVLLNCEEVKPYLGRVVFLLPIEFIIQSASILIGFIKCDTIFTEQVRTARPNINDADVDTIIETHFAGLFIENVSIITHLFIILT